MKVPEFAEPADRVTVAVKITAPEHDASFGPYRLNVTVPVGLKPPETVAVSEICVGPSAPPAEAVVAIVGVAGLTVVDSFAALHGWLTAL